MIIIQKREEDVIDWLMAFPKYRRLKNRLKIVNKDNRTLRKNWQEQIVINDNLKDKIKKREQTIYKLRKELKELKNNEITRRYETGK